MASFQQPKSFLTQILEALFGGTFRAGPGPQSQPTKEELARRNHDNHVLAGKVRDLEQQIEELQHTCADLERVAMCDPLTGLYNRRGGEHELGRVLARFKRREYDYSQVHHGGFPSLEFASVVVIDIDDFKQINDNFGHAEGDRILIAIAEHIRREFRSNDIVIRWGGDEFVVYAIDALQDAMVTRAQELILAIKIDPGLRIGDSKVTCSIGLAGGRFTTERGAHALIGRLRKNADEAMYQAKRDHGPGSCIAAPEEIDSDHPL